MYSFKNLISNISLFLILASGKINAKETVNILINKPDIGENQYLDNYNELMNQFFTNNNIEDVEVKFSYCAPDDYDGTNILNLYKEFKSPYTLDIEYAKSFNCIIRELKRSNYDLMILDDRFLFSDNSYLDNTVLQSEFSYSKVIDYLAEYNIVNENINFHDRNILKDGKGDTELLYGLPYELDFDVLYYHDVDEGLKDSLSLKVKELQSDEKVNDIVSAGLKNNDELFNLLAEFLSYQYGLPKENDPESYTSLYKDKEILNSLRKYMKGLMGSDIEKTLSTTVEEAYTNFAEGKKPLLKGKASYYNGLNQNPEIIVKASALPENKSVITEKYVVMNRNSLKPKETLQQIALQLTSKEMQYYRALQFGSIPTFDFKNLSEDATSYCQAHAEMCELLKTISPIRIRNIVRKRNYSASFLESRLIVPTALRESLTDSSNDIVQKAFLNILDISNKNFEQTKVDLFLIMFLVLNVITIIIAILLFLVILKVYRNRKHPYIKAVSPQLTNLTILGIILKIIYPYFFLLIDTRFLCRMSVIVNFEINNITFIPLFAIIFRIYYIYTNISSVSYGKKLHDKRLIIYILIGLVIAFFAAYGISYFGYFNLTTTGSLTDNRFMTCMYDFKANLIITNSYTLILFVIMMAMTIRVRKLSKKYGDTTFIFFIILLLLSSCLSESAYAAFFKTDGGSSVTNYSIVLIYIHMIFSMITVHFLIGKRLLYIRKHPVKNKEKLYKKDFNNINNLVEFIPIKKNDSSSFTYFDSSNGVSSTGNKSINKSSMAKTYIRMDGDMEGQYDNDSNYRAFTQSLHKYLSEDEDEDMNQDKVNMDKQNNMNYNSSYNTSNFNNSNYNTSDFNNNYGNYSFNSNNKNSFYYYNELNNNIK